MWKGINNIDSIAFLYYSINSLIKTIMESVPEKKKQYIMALVHLPIEIASNGTCEPMHNRIHISFEPCEVLPKTTNSSETAAFAAHFRGILSSFTHQSSENQESVFKKVTLEEVDNDEDEDDEDDDNDETDSIEYESDKDDSHLDADAEIHENESNPSILYVLQSEIQQHNRKIKQTFDITFKKRDKPSHRHTAKLR